MLLMVGEVDDADVTNERGPAADECGGQHFLKYRTPETLLSVHL